MQQPEEDGEAERTIRSVFVGDNAVGKTSIVLMAARRRRDDADATQQMFVSYSTTLPIDGVSVGVELCDTQAGKVGGFRRGRERERERALL